MLAGLFGLPDRCGDAAELAATNHRKRGRPYRYPHSLMMAIATLHHSLDPSFGACEGMTGACMWGEGS